MDELYRTYTTASADFVGVLLRPGPGDALRFSFALTNYILVNKPRNPILIITDFAERNVLSLLYQSPSVGKPMEVKDHGAFLRIRTSSGLCLIKITEIQFEPLLAEMENKTLYHAFEPPFTDYSPQKINRLANKFPKINFELLDRTNGKAYMSGSFACNFVIPRPAFRRYSKRVIVMIRDELLVPHRNTPIALFRKLVYLLLRRDYQVSFSGSPLPETAKLTPSEKAYVRKHHLFADGIYPSYFEQMVYYAANFDLAIGVNSGGLDLAFAGGLAGVRVGAFHHLLPHHGPDYNSFVSGDQVVEIASLTEYDLSNITLLACARAVGHLEIIQEMRLQQFLP